MVKGIKSHKLLVIFLLLLLFIAVSVAVRYYRKWSILFPLKEKIAQRFDPEIFQIDHAGFEDRKITSLYITAAVSGADTAHLMADCHNIQTIISQYINENPKGFAIDKDHYFGVTYSHNVTGGKEREHFLVFSNEDNTFERKEGTQKKYCDTFRKLSVRDEDRSSDPQDKIPLNEFSVFTGISYLYLDMGRCVEPGDITALLNMPDLKYINFSGFEEEDYQKWSTVWDPLFREKGILAEYEGRERPNILLGQELEDKYRIRDQYTGDDRTEAFYIDVDTSLVTGKDIFSDLEMLMTMINDTMKKYPDKFAIYPEERISASKGFEVYFYDGNQDETGIFSLCNYIMMSGTYEEELCSLRFYKKKIGEYSFSLGDMKACTGVKEIVCYPGMEVDDAEALGSIAGLKYLYWNPSDKNVSLIKRAAQKYEVSFLAELPYE